MAVAFAAAKARASSRDVGPIGVLGEMVAMVSVGELAMEGETSDICSSWSYRSGTGLMEEGEEAVASI